MKLLVIIISIGNALPEITIILECGLPPLLGFKMWLSSLKRISNSIKLFSVIF